MGAARSAARIARAGTSIGDRSNETYFKSAAWTILHVAERVATGKASTMELRKFWHGLAISLALLGLAACAIYQPAPGPTPYSYAPRPVYSSPFLGFGFGFL